jgi:hypothetical protein
MTVYTPRTPGERRARFIEIVSECETSFAEAARMAGYSITGIDGSRLLGDPEIVGEILRRIQPKLVKFQALNSKAFAALDYILSPDNWRSVGTTNTGTPVYEVTARDRVSAALGWLKIVSEVDPDSLQEKARGADARESLRVLADRVVTENIPAVVGREAAVQVEGRVEVIDVDSEPVAPNAVPEPESDPPAVGPQPLDPTGTEPE